MDIIMLCFRCSVGWRFSLIEGSWMSISKWLVGKRESVGTPRFGASGFTLMIQVHCFGNIVLVLYHLKIIHGLKDEG